MTNAMDWQGATGRNWADEWRRTDRSFAELTARLLDRIAQRPGRDVLDIGCGAGELSHAIAVARRDARVTGLDISPELVAAASARAGENARFFLGDAASWAEPGFSPDLLVSRHGVMFFDDPPAAFAHLAAISAPGAALVFSCFRAPALNPWATGIGKLVAAPDAPPPDPEAPGPFAFAEPDRVRRILEPAWTDVVFEEADLRYIAGAGEDPVADSLAFFSRIGPFAAALRETLPERRAELEARLTAFVQSNCSGGTVGFPAAAWIVTARKA